MTKEVKIEKEYIVISVTSSGSEKVFNKLIACNRYAIRKYIESLSFGAEIELWFFSISRLEEISEMSYRSSSVEYITMNNLKSFYDFRNEVDELIKKLEIKSKDSEEEVEE